MPLEYNKIYCCDNVEGMRQLPNNCENGGCARQKIHQL